MSSGNPTLSVPTLSRHMQLPLLQLPLSQLFGPQDLLSLVPDQAYQRSFLENHAIMHVYVRVYTCMYMHICIGMPITIHIYTTQEPLISIHAHMFAFQYPYDYMHVEYQPKELHKVHARTYVHCTLAWTYTAILYICWLVTHTYILIYHISCLRIHTCTYKECVCWSMCDAYVHMYMTPLCLLLT